jgi:hypothetical protein
MMLDDDVHSWLQYEIDGRQEDTSPASLREVMRALNKQLKTDELKQQPPALIGFHMQHGQHRPSSEPWAAAHETSLACVALSVLTSVRTQFHPYAQLAEDSDFFQRVLAEWEDAGNGGQPALKCNLFGCRTVDSGGAGGAVRTQDRFGEQLAMFLQEQLDFDPATRIEMFGSWPMFRSVHPWTFRKAHNGFYESTLFEFNRPAALTHLRSIPQGILIWLKERDLPMGEPKTGRLAMDKLKWAEAINQFLSKLKRPGLMVLPAKKARLVDRLVERGLASSTVELPVPWRRADSSYLFVKVEPIKLAKDSEQKEEAAAGRKKQKPEDQTTPGTSSNHVRARAGPPSIAAAAFTDCCAH